MKGCGCQYYQYILFDMVRTPLIDYDTSIFGGNEMRGNKKDVHGQV